MRIEKLVHRLAPGGEHVYLSRDERFVVRHHSAGGYEITDTRSGRQQRCLTLMEAALVTTATRAFDSTYHA